MNDKQFKSDSTLNSALPPTIIPLSKVESLEWIPKTEYTLMKRLVPIKQIYGFDGSKTTLNGE